MASFADGRRRRRVCRVFQPAGGHTRFRRGKSLRCRRDLRGCGEGGACAPRRGPAAVARVAHRTGRRRARGGIDGSLPRDGGGHRHRRARIRPTWSHTFPFRRRRRARGGGPRPTRARAGFRLGRRLALRGVRGAVAVRPRRRPPPAARTVDGGGDGASHLTPGRHRIGREVVRAGRCAPDGVAGCRRWLRAGGVAPAQDRGARRGRRRAGPRRRNSRRDAGAQKVPRASQRRGRRARRHALARCRIASHVGRRVIRPRTSRRAMGVCG